MKKRVIRLNESEMVRLVERIVKRVNKKPLRESRNRRRFIKESNVLDTYDLTIIWSTGDPEEEGFVEGLLNVDIPKSLAQQITGIDDETMRNEGEQEYGIFSDIGDELVEFALDSYYQGNYNKSIDTDTGEDVEPDIDSGFTEGVVVLAYHR